VRVTGYLNDDRGGWTELRVHGVAGTPPERMLQHLQVRRVAGDARAGFYRREWDTAAVSRDTPAERLEAYSWGELTAGGAQRALWLLLTPFLLVNVAYWALPHVETDGRFGHRAVRRVAEAVQRLFALSITGTLVLATVLVSMDFAGWQCVRPGGGCTRQVSWLGFLNWPGLGLPGRRVAVTAVVPLAVVGLLWWLANKTWAALESAPVPGAEPDPHQSPLEDRRIWNGVGPVRRLRAVHVTAGLSFIALFLVAPVAGRDGGGAVPLLGGGAAALAPGGPAPGWRLPAQLLLAGVLGLIAASVLLVCLPAMSDRERPGAVVVVRRQDLYTVLPWLAVGLNLLAAVVAWQPGAGPAGTVAGADPTTVAGPGQLPWFAATVQILLEVQIGLLVVMLALLLALRRFAPAQPRPRSAAPDAQPLDVRPAWGGLTTAVLMLMSLVLAAGFAAGMGLRIADLLGDPTPGGGGERAVVVPMGYFWAAALAVPLAVVVLLVAGAGVLLLRREAGRVLLDQVIPAYPDADVAAALATPDEPGHAAILRRARQIAVTWARAVISNVGQRLGGIFVLLVLAIVGTGLAGYLLDPEWIYVHAHWTVTVGTFLVGGFTLGLLYVGRQAYLNPGFRRTVGIVWDIGTFWPRAAHPLAPPCYAERTVPELINRIGYLGDTGRIVFSCHSQGAVIGTAVMMQLTYEQSSRVALLTYGSPVRRLYARFFPGYFNTDALLRCGASLLGPPQPGDGTDPETRRRWPWRNLYRPSDPIGGPVLFGYPAQERAPAPADHPPAPADHPPAPAGDSTEDAGQRDPDDNDDIDRQLVDPLFARRDGDICYPSTCGHSDYFRDPAFARSVATVRRLRAHDAAVADVTGTGSDVAAAPDPVATG
jgi:hypothetical protein